MRSRAIFKPDQEESLDKALSHMRSRLGLILTLSLNQTEDSPKGFISERHTRSGAAVKFWQEQLYWWAKTQPDLKSKYANFKISGNWHPNFTLLIKDFQRKHGLDVDGVIGPSFFRAFLTRYFFDSGGKNVGLKAFETKFFPLISFEEYLRVISTRRTADALKRCFPTKPTISAKEVLDSPSMVEKFKLVFDRFSQNQAPLSAREFLELCAQYDFDPCLALSQAVIESHIGTRGLAKKTKNIFNVGNTDDGKVRTFRCFKEGMIAYLELMKRNFASSRSEFVGRQGRNLNRGHYATKVGYVKKVNQLALTIEKDLKRNTSPNLNKVQKHPT